MRVIAGTYRSRSLKAPRGLATRPTSDRLRETLFNVLGARVEGALFADLYAGSGAVGIEALSRGAGAVCFVENAPSALATIRANLASLKIQSGYRIDSRGVSTALRDLCLAQAAAQGMKTHGPAEWKAGPGAEPPESWAGSWHLIFLDPPYEDARAYSNTLTTLGEVAPTILAPGGMVIAEHARKSVHTVAGSYGLLHRIRVIEQGDAALSFYQAANSG